MGQRKRVKLSSSTKGKLLLLPAALWVAWLRLLIMFFLMPLDPCIIESLKHKCFLEELLFWTIKYEFPQKMVTFLLNMLPDQDYKVFFSSLINII